MSNTTKLSKEDQEALMRWPEVYGIPIFPAYTANKLITLKGWPTKDFSKTDFRKEVLKGAYDNGAAARLGLTLDGKLHTVALDFDGDDSVNAWFESWNHVLSAARRTLIEWHQDKGKIHVLFFAKEPIQKQQIHIGPNKVLLEVRCEQQVIFISPSKHKDGNKYTPLGINKIETIDDIGLLKLKSQINALSEKWVSDADKDRYDAMLDEPSTILGEGSGRHTATLFKVRSFFWKYTGEWLNLPDSERFDRAWEWHQAHCKPSRTREEFDRICEWVIRTDRKKRDAEHDNIREQRNQQQEQEQQQKQKAFIGSDIIVQSVHDELKKHKWSILSHDGPKFIIAHSDLNQTLEGAQFERSIFNNDGTKYTEHYLQLRDVHINAVPIEIIRHEDPINTTFLLEQHYKITFKTSAGKTLKTPEYMSLDDIITFLNSKSLICSSQGAKAALAHVIHTFDCNDEIKISKEIEASGFFLVDGKIVASHIEIKDHTIEEIKAAALFLNELVNKFKRLEVISTVIHWGLAAPFNYVLKQYTDDVVWMQWLGLSGSTQVGKTTDGRIACGLLGHFSDMKYNIPFTSVSTIATLGKKFSQSALPLNIQETDDLVSDDKRGIRDTLKGCVQGRTSRSKYVSRTTYADIPSLPACVFSSNQPFPEDPGFRSKFIYITYTANDRFWTIKQQTEFNAFMSKGLKHLKVIGEFNAKYILDNPSVLLKDNPEECNWKETSATVLNEMYKTAALKIPEWIGLFVQEIDTTSAAIEDAHDSAYFQLVGMFTQDIIDGYRKDPKPKLDFESKTYIETSFIDKLAYCLKERLVPYLLERQGDKNNLRYIAITSDVMGEIKKRKIPNITSMDALANEIPNFSYGVIKIGGKPKRAIYGLYNQFEDFVNPHIEEIKEVKDNDKNA